MTIGERIRAARTEREMSLSDLARSTYLSKGFISQVESGTSNPSPRACVKLAVALNPAPGAFLDENTFVRFCDLADRRVNDCACACWGTRRNHRSLS